MSKVKFENVIAKKIMFIIFAIIALIALVYFAMKILVNSDTNEVYDLGEKTTDSNYKDEILSSYDDYSEFLKKLNLEPFLDKEDFNNNYYLASFQEYDKCSESKHKSINYVNATETQITVEYKFYNKCGWCRSHIVLYLIPIEKLNYQNPSINYSYDYGEDIDCGTV